MIHHSIEVHRSSIDKHFQLAFNPHHPTTALHPAMPSVYEPELSLPQSNEAFFFTASAMASRSASSRRRWRSTLISWQLRSIGALLTKKSWTLCEADGQKSSWFLMVCWLEYVWPAESPCFSLMGSSSRHAPTSAGAYSTIFHKTSLACLLIFCSKTI